MEFDLTIENYSLPDLIQFFHLTPENKTYTRSDIELIEYELRTKIRKRRIGHQIFETPC